MLGANVSRIIVGLKLPSISMEGGLNGVILLQHLNENSHFHAPVSSRCEIQKSA